MSEGLILIQARLGSTRFPRKILAPLAGKPVLTWVAERALAVGLPTMVTCPASDLGPVRDAVPGDALVFGSNRPVDDVLGRFTDVLRHSKSRPPYIVRLTADSPFLDPDVIMDIIRIFESGRSHGVDRETGRHWSSTYHYAANCYPPPACADGGLDVEVVDTIAFLEADTRVRCQPNPQDLEHPTRYLWSNPERFSCVQVPIPHNYGHLGIRWMIDTPGDLTRLEPVAQRLLEPADRPYDWQRTRQAEAMAQEAAT